MDHDALTRPDRTRCLVSACLLGTPCRYDGRSKSDRHVISLGESWDFVPVCPELLGGLPIPRTPSERVASEPKPRVIASDGEDRTAAFELGAERVVALAQEKNCELAVLKSKSPSCGSRQIYDGSFTRTLVPGQGVATQRLREAGVTVIDEHEFVERYGRE